MTKKEIKSKQQSDDRLRKFLETNKVILNVSGLEKKFGFNKGGLDRLKNHGSSIQKKYAIARLYNFLVIEEYKYKSQLDKQFRVVSFIQDNKDILNISGIERTALIPSGTLYKILNIRNRKLSGENIKNIDNLILKSLKVISK